MKKYTYFYFSANLELMYCNHLDVTIMFRYLITYFLRLWLSRRTISNVTSGEGVSSTQHCHVAGALGWLLEPPVPLPPRHLF